MMVPDSNLTLRTTQNRYYMVVFLPIISVAELQGFSGTWRCCSLTCHRQWSLGQHINLTALPSVKITLPCLPNKCCCFWMPFLTVDTRSQLIEPSPVWYSILVTLDVISANGFVIFIKEPWSFVWWYLWVEVKRRARANSGQPTRPKQQGVKM